MESIFSKKNSALKALYYDIINYVENINFDKKKLHNNYILHYKYIYMPFCFDNPN